MATAQHAQVVARTMGGAHAGIPPGVAQQRSAPEVIMRTTEDSEQVLRQPGLSRDMVGTSAHQKVYRPEGKLPEPEEDSHRPGAHDMQLIDLTTEEPALLEELGSGKPAGKTCLSDTTNMGVGRAERHLAGQVDWQAGMKKKRFHCGHAPQGLGTAETLHHKGNLTDERAPRNPT
jgi:hypothetical protein